MKPRKPRDMKKALSKKGFVQDSSVDHHEYYYLWVDGKKSAIYTYFSHGKNSKEYDKRLMGQVKRQLRFKNSNDMDDLFDCPLDHKGYVALLNDSDEL